MNNTLIILITLIIVYFILFILVRTIHKAIHYTQLNFIETLLVSTQIIGLIFVIISISMLISATFDIIINDISQGGNNG